jgi:hypothetical protein
VGLADWLRRRVPDDVRSVLRAEHLLVVSVWLRRGLRSREHVFKLFGMLGFAMQHVRFLRTGAVQLMLNVHRRIRARSILSMRFVMRLQHL